MNPADRIALVERMARALHWTGMTEDERIAARRRASDMVEEIEIGQQQTDRIGWILVDTPPGDREDAET